MALVIGPRTQETGTGTAAGEPIPLTGPTTNMQAFAIGVGDGNATFVTAIDAAGAWVHFLANFIEGSPDTLTRELVLGSSGGGGDLDLVGDVTVFSVIPPDLTTWLDAYFDTSPASEGTILRRGGVSWEALPPGDPGTALTMLSSTSQGWVGAGGGNLASGELLGNSTSSSAPAAAAKPSGVLYRFFAPAAEIEGMTLRGTDSGNVNTSFTLEVPQRVRPVQTGTTYTLDWPDAGSWIPGNNASPIAWTIPTSATRNFPIGTVIAGEQRGAGQITVAGAGGVTLIVASPLTAVSRAQGSVFHMKKLATNTWIIWGDLA